MRRFVLRLVLLTCGRARRDAGPGEAESVPPLADLDAYVARVDEGLRCPGIAVAVVKDGRVVIEKGYGVKRLGASGSRRCRHPLRHRLEHEGLHRGRPGPARGRRQARLGRPGDAAPSGLRDVRPVRVAGDDGPRPGHPPRGPRARRGRPPVVAADDLHARRDRGGVRYVKPASSFRSRYAYNNVLYVVAGEVVAAVIGRRWDDFVRERIFSPLGMSRTHHERRRLPRQRGRGPPRGGGGGGPVAVMSFDNVGPAGGRSTPRASDMARWVEVLLECGGGGGARRRDVPAAPESIPRDVVGPDGARIARPAPGPRGPQADFAAYGLGFGLRDYRGRKWCATPAGCPATSRRWRSSRRSASGWWS